MKRFIIEQSDTEITSTSGFALIGAAINNHTNLNEELNSIPLRHGISHADIIKSYLGVLCTGKNDFEAVSAVQNDQFFKDALNIKKGPSVDRLRQRMDERAESYLPILQQASIYFLSSTETPITPLAMGHVPLDADVTPFDNSRTKKEGVSWTYKNHDGYAPMAIYIGQEGYCIDFELREGKQHCQKNTPSFLNRALENSIKVTNQPILLRLDSGNDAIENMDVVLEFNKQNPEHDVDFIIKWNPRSEKKNEWLEIAENKAIWDDVRPGKRVGLFEETVVREWEGFEYTVRRVMQVTERTIDNKGQALLFPEVEVEGWWTSLSLAPKKIIALYADHGTSEQFHSEFKTDMDIERLPSGKFSTNELVLACSALSYNILRYLGQNGLTGKDAPLRHKAKRRRIKTVMQELIYLAARIVKTGRRLKIKFGKNCQVKGIFFRLYNKLAYD